MSKFFDFLFFLNSDRQIATVAVETVQLVLSQFENFLTQWIENWMSYLWAKKNLVNVVNWWSYVTLNVMVRVYFLTRKIVSEMTYNVSSGTLNPTTLWFKKTRQLWRTITTTQFSRF